MQTNAATVLATFFSAENPDANYAQGIYWPFMSLFVRRTMVRKGTRLRPGKARPVIDAGRVAVELVGAGLRAAA